MENQNEQLHSTAYTSSHPTLPVDPLHLSHSFGYDSRRRANLQLLDDATLLLVAGKLLVLLEVGSGQQRYLHSCSTQGIGAITAHPQKKYFVVAEKGPQPVITVYEYPSLRAQRTLRGGTERGYSSVDFNQDGGLLASVGGAPDYMLTLWDWRKEEVMLSCKASSQEVYRVNFSPHNAQLLTSSGRGHIKFWTISTTFTGLKLQGTLGHFGETAATDIEGFVELPDGKVVTGTEWGNLLLWEGETIKVEICRKEGRSCHTGTVQPFSLEDGQLMTFGSDGVIRNWEIEKMMLAEGSTRSGRLEMEPNDELLVGDQASLSSVVKSSLLSIWFAQDSNGAIWKLDLSFNHTTPDPECLFSFHAGPIRGLDVSTTSHLMATTALDRSVRVFDFFTKKELSRSWFNQGGTALCWAPPLGTGGAALVAAGFEDGVLRLLEISRLQVLTKEDEDGKLMLKQAFKPHSQSITALVYGRDGKTLATGSADGTVFFFSVGGSYRPVGLVRVPGPVRALDWSPVSHCGQRLLILCVSGHVVEVDCPKHTNQEAHSYQLTELHTRNFTFHSIKRDIERARETGPLPATTQEKKEEGEKEEELPPISSLYCGFYSEPDQFWLSMGGFDSGYLYHCKFSANQEEGPDERQDKPFHFLPIHNAESDPICSVTFSCSRHLLLCLMYSGSIRVYPLTPGDLSLTSMKDYWTLSVHDNHSGHLPHVRCSHDELFVLTAGADGNIFSFTVLPPEELESSVQTPTQPSPMVGSENQALVLDIEDPAAKSLESDKQRQEKERLRREAARLMAGAEHKRAELQNKFQQVLEENQSLASHVRLQPQELQLNHRFNEQAENLKAHQVSQVRMELTWEQERCSIQLNKLQECFRDSLETDVVTVRGVKSSHTVTTYPLPSVTTGRGMATTPSPPPQDAGSSSTAPARKTSSRQTPKNANSTEGPDIFHHPVVWRSLVKLGGRQEEMLQKAAEKAKQLRAKLEKRKQEWAAIYAEKPEEDDECPLEVQDLLEAREKMWEVPGRNRNESLERKTEELMALEQHICERQAEMNQRIVALQRCKTSLLSSLHQQQQQLQPPTSPEETPESHGYQLNREQGNCAQQEEEEEEAEEEEEVEEEEEEEGAVGLLEQQEEGGKDNQRTEESRSASLSNSSISSKRQEDAETSGVKEEIKKEEEIRLLYEQKRLLEQVQREVSQFDEELQMLRSHKFLLDDDLKRADMCRLLLMEEVLLLEHFESRRSSLQINEHLKEESRVTAKLEECKAQLEEKVRDIATVQQREKALGAAFKASLGENHQLETFLTKVFKKKIKRATKKETTKHDEEEEEESDDESEEADWDAVHYSDPEEQDALLDDSVCPPGCEPELFEHTLQLRERRLDLEEVLMEEKEAADLLRKEWDVLVKKEKMMKSKRKAAENLLDQINREIQENMDQLELLVPVKLHQIKLVVDGATPTDLSPALVITQRELSRLQDAVQRLQAEYVHHRELHQQDQQQHNQLLSDCRDLSSRVKVLEKKCEEVMMSKFGGLVDLVELQSVPENRRQEELQQEKLLRGAAHHKEMGQWEVKVEEARQALMEEITQNTQHGRRLLLALDSKKKKELQQSHRKRQTTGRQHVLVHGRTLDQDQIQRLLQLVHMQSEQIKAIRREIGLLSSKGGRVLPCDLTLLAPTPARAPYHRPPV